MNTSAVSDFDAGPGAQTLDEPAVIAAMAALAQPARLRLFRSLVVAGAQGLTPGRLGELLALPASTLSFHLKELSHAGLVAVQRDGRSLIYRASFARMRDLLGYLTAHCCQGQAGGKADRLRPRVLPMNPAGCCLPVPQAPIAQQFSASVLNRNCFCFALDQATLAGALDAELGRDGLADLVHERNPNLFAAQPVFVAASQLQRIEQVIAAIDTVAAMPAYRQLVLGQAGIAGTRSGAAGPRGVFFGYDFHVSGDRLGLIEINTNAGGAMLNAVLARAQRACCPALEWLVPGADAVDRFEQQIVDMFRTEWRLSGRDAALATIAIVDDDPASQYLYPEFLLFQSLFRRHGIAAVIADPGQLAGRDGALWFGDTRIDLVYNRLTDFGLDAPASAVLRQAWLDEAVVLTPDPRAHTLFADKRRLELFSDDAAMAALGVPADVRELLLAHVPRTELVTPDAADRLWAARRDLFFKPVSGFGSRAAYRGDKLTRRVWQQILAGDYVAQALVVPGERVVDSADAAPALKFDLRAYAYDGASQWLAARLYQGQTTNFRTPGGGFAPVFSLPIGAVTGL